MPTRRRKLKERAIESCKLRHHKMGHFSYVKNNNFDTATCELCGMYVDVKVKPLPNEIDIGGSAVALNCEK